MALSQKKTTVAVLRGILGAYHGREDNFARMIKCSPSWVKKVSAGLISLTEEKALLLQIETGISFNWLMGSPDEPAIDARGEAYRRETYEWIRARRREGRAAGVQIGFKPMDFLPDIAGIGSASGDKGKAAIFRWRLDSFLDKQRQEFGIDHEAFRTVAKLLMENPAVSNFVIHDKGPDPKIFAEVEAKAKETVTKELKSRQSRQSSPNPRKAKSTRKRPRRAS